MTPTEIETSARQRYNAIGDTHWSQNEILDLIYAASMDLALKTYCIKNLYQTTSTVSQDELAVPTNSVAIKRIEYDYRKLEPISERQRDDIIGHNAASSVLGTPEGYVLFGQSIFLVKTPSETGKVIRIWSFDQPSSVENDSTLDIPVRYHHYLIDYIMAKMFAKDRRFDLTQYHMSQWDANVDYAKIFELKRSAKDTIQQVQRDPDYNFGMR